MRNDFLTSDCARILLPALPDPACVYPPLLSQVCGVIIAPFGVGTPLDWTNQTQFEAMIDNAVTDNSAAKYLPGRGELPAPTEIIVQLGKDERRITRRLYVLTMEVPTYEDARYAFLTKLQVGYKGFRFWFATVGGRLLGRPAGIIPDLVSVSFPYGGGDEDLEKGVLRIEWFADGDPPRTYMPGILDTGGGGSSPPVLENIMLYRQAFPSQTAAVLTWTENAGNLPSSNTDAQVWVYQNGQKIWESLQYSIAHATAPGESEITIDALTHYAGANYEVITITTA